MLGFRPPPRCGNVAVSSSHDVASTGQRTDAHMALACAIFAQISAAQNIKVPLKRQQGQQTVNLLSWAQPLRSMKGMRAPPWDPLTVTLPMRVATVPPSRPKKMMTRPRATQRHSDPPPGPQVAAEGSVSAAAGQHLHNCGRGASLTITMPSLHMQQPQPRRQWLRKNW